MTHQGIGIALMTGLRKKAPIVPGASRNARPLVMAGALVLIAVPLGPSWAESAPRTVGLTQVPCQFLESEGVDRGYKSRSIKDCEAINAKTGEQRVAQAKPLELEAGKYVFRVTNKNVPYELGFWLRGASALSRVTLPSVSGPGLFPGKSRDYEIELKPGEYLYSCPLNTTPDYKLIVK